MDGPFERGVVVYSFARDEAPVVGAISSPWPVVEQRLLRKACRSLARARRRFVLLAAVGGRHCRRGIVLTAARLWPSCIHLVQVSRSAVYAEAQSRYVPYSVQTGQSFLPKEMGLK